MELFDIEKLDPIRSALVAKSETIAVAESVTAGLLQYAVGSILEASTFYQGGITAYNIGQKYKHLRVEPVHAAKTNCVSERVAIEMGINVCTLFNSDWGIGVTGYASPVPESNNEVFAYYSIIYRGEVKRITRIDPAPAKPFDLQLRYVNDALTELIRLVK